MEQTESFGWEDYTCPECHTRDDVVIEIYGSLVFKHVRCCDHILVEVA